jgi:hypothetical protein
MANKIDKRESLLQLRIAEDSKITQIPNKPSVLLQWWLDSNPRGAGDVATKLSFSATFPFFFQKKIAEKSLWPFMASIGSMWQYL